MAAVARIGDLISTGHGCDGTAPIGEGSTNVFINGIGCARQTDAIAPHTILSGIVCVPHSAVINTGLATVLVNGLPIARVGDSADQGSIIEGSLNVFAGP